MTLAPDLFRALAALCESPDPAHARLAETLGLPGRSDPESHTELFVFQLVPYASVYLGPEGKIGGEARDTIAGFWRALRLIPPAEPDHLAALLGLYATLGERECGEAEPARRLLWRQARQAMLWEHLLTWLPPYLHAVTEAAPRFYTAWAQLLRDALLAEAAELTGPPDSLIHLRGLPAPPDGASDAFIRGLLTPARSGVILTRRDIARGARAMKLGLRAGERAFSLRWLISQDPVAACGWLETEAARCEAWHSADRPALGDIAVHWLSRAEATRHALRRTQDTAMDLVKATQR